MLRQQKPLLGVYQILGSHDTKKMPQACCVVSWLLNMGDARLSPFLEAVRPLPEVSDTHIICRPYLIISTRSKAH